MNNNQWKTCNSKYPPNFEAWRNMKHSSSKPQYPKSLQKNILFTHLQNPPPTTQNSHADKHYSFRIDPANFQKNDKIGFKK